MNELQVVSSEDRVCALNKTIFSRAYVEQMISMECFSDEIWALIEKTQEIYFEQISKKIYSLTQYFINGLKSLPIYRVFSKPNACGIVAFEHKNIQAEYLAGVLSSTYDIAVRGGLHCAPLMHEALGTQGGLTRVSFSHFNTTKEIDVLLNALTKLKNAKEEY